MRRGLLTCAWGRRELAEIVLDYTRSIIDAAEDAYWTRIAVVSDDADARIARVADWCSTRAPNDPRGAKWNAGLAHLRYIDSDIDAVMILGTDDLLSAGVFRAAVDAIRSGADWFGLRDAYIYSVAEERLVYWPGYDPHSGRVGETIGTARTYSRRYLDACDWKLWPDEATDGLDSFANPARSKFSGVVASVRDVGAVVDVKAYPGVALGSFYSFAGALPVEAADVWAQFPEETVGKVLSLREKLNGSAVPASAEPPLIAGCLIARDCEKTIGRALFSLRGVADELVVVVDSRTRDDTATIAAKHGARVVYRDFDDFAGQRNASLEAATAPWAFILDADEWLENPGNIRECVEKAPTDCDSIAISFAYADGSPNFADGVAFQERVVRRERVRYKFPAHHALVGVRERMTCDGLVMEHYSAEQVEHSAKRAIDRLLPLLDGTDPRYEAKEARGHALYYIARSYASLQSWADAIRYAELCAKEYPENASNWLTLIRAIERKDGLIATGAAIHHAVIAHPYFRPLRWWAGRLQFGIMLDMIGRPNPYEMTPTSESRYLPHLDAALPFLGFTVTRATAPGAVAPKPDAPRIVAP